MADFIIYNTKDGEAAIKLYANDGTVWLTQAQIAELFNKERSGITKHIKNIFDEGELDEKSNVNFFHISNSDKTVSFYSLDFILAVGFRVRSPRGTQFRQWANGTLKEYLQKGFVLDKDRLKNPDGPRTTSTSCLSRSAIFAPAKSVFTRNCVTCSRFPAITKSPKKLRICFLQKRRTNFFTAQQVKPPLKLSTHAQMQMLRTWPLLHGVVHECARLTLL